MQTVNATSLALIALLLSPAGVGMADEHGGAAQEPRDNAAAGAARAESPEPPADLTGPSPADADSPPELPPVPDDDEAAAAAIEAAYRRFLRLREEDRDQEAMRAALQVAELTQQRYGPDAIELATPLINLAVMQSQTGDLPAAEQNYRAAIQVIERREGMLSARLINPLTGLGHTYNRAGMHDQAIESFERALRLNNIELGFTNFEQFGIQDGLTQSYVGIGDFEEANFYQETQVEIYQRKFGSEDPAVVPAMYKLAEWYSRIGDLEQSALTYRGADRILRESEGEASESRTDGLMGLARLYERQGNRPAAASTLRKAVKVVEANPEPNHLRRAQVHVALGDLYSREARPNSARVEYEIAWADLSSDDAHLEERDRVFKLPVRLAGGPFPDLASSGRGRPLPELREGFVVIRYSVDAEGRAQDVTVIESDPPDLIEEALLTTYRRSLYRPRFVDGVPTPTENLLSRHEFRYAGAARAEQADPGDLPPPARDRGRLERPGD